MSINCSFSSNTPSRVARPGQAWCLSCGAEAAHREIVMMIKVFVTHSRWVAEEELSPFEVERALNDGNWEGFFLVLNAVNWLAKTTGWFEDGAQEYWYSVKDSMLREACMAEETIHGLWYQAGIVYFEGETVQVSFHVVDEESLEIWDDSDYNREGPGWSQIPVQSAGISLLANWIKAQSK
jgi:hypothetical protein